MTYFSAILEKPSFKKHNITVDTKNNLLQLPIMKVQFNQNLLQKGKKSQMKNILKVPLILTLPQLQVLSEFRWTKF